MQKRPGLLYRHGSGDDSKEDTFPAGRKYCSEILLNFGTETIPVVEHAL